MVTNSGETETSSARDGSMGRRRRSWREPVYVWWAGFALLGAIAGTTRSWRLLLLALLLWCLYEFALIPTACRMMTRQGASCREPARGRLFGCSPEHQRLKNEGLRRLVGLRPRRREEPAPDPNRDTGVVVWSPESRGRLHSDDRAMIITACTATVIVLLGTLYGLTGGT